MSSIVNAIFDFAVRHKCKAIITTEGLPKGDEDEIPEEDEDMSRDEILVSSS